MEKEKVIQELEKEVKEKIDTSQFKKQSKFTGKSKIKLTLNRELNEEEYEKVRKVLNL